jgi:hypothetical protein
MSDRSHDLAQQFELASGEFTREVESASSERWRAQCSGEGWSYGVVAHHVASSLPAVTEIVKALANGEPTPPFSLDLVNQGNAQHARDFANATREETLDLLRQHTQPATDVVRSLNDDQLDRTKAWLEGMPAMSTQAVIENVMINHVSNHLQSLRTAS